MTGIIQATFSALYEADDWVTLIVLGFMVLFTVTKNLAQDIIRINNDKQINFRPYQVWSGADFTSVACKDLKVGHLVVLKTGDIAPADLLVLAGSTSGSCLADLKPLTGRKNLSEKTALRETQVLLEGWQARSELISKLEGDLLVPQPTSDIHKFEGKLRLKGYPRAVPLSPINLLPRDSIILKTDFLLCLAVYVGTETKTMMSQSSTNRKVTRLESRLNRVSWLLVGVALVISVICAVTGVDMEMDDDLSFGEHILTYILLYQHILPITLFFLLDTIRLVQVILIERSGRFKMTTSNVNDEIAQIEYLLTDKTGTLTNAELKLRMCKLKGVDYVTDYDAVNESEESVDDLVKQTKNSSFSLIHSNSQPLSAIASEADSQLFMLGLLLCNNVYTEPSGELFGESADELAIVDGVQSSGYRLIERTASSVKVQIRGRVQEFYVHAIIPFNPESRRMSTLVQAVGSDNAYLIVKGAVDTMQKVCKTDDLDDLIESSDLNIAKGLRCIAFGCKALGVDETADLVETLDYSRGAANEEGRVMAALAEHDEGISLLGKAYLEETVNPNVADTIQRLKEVGIKIWMVTGDSANSAYSVALTSRLTTVETEHLQLTGYISQVDLKRNLIMAIKRCLYGEFSGIPLDRLASITSPRAGQSAQKSNTLERIKRQSRGKQKLFKSTTVNTESPIEMLEEPIETNLVKFAMTVDGATLKLALADPESRKILTCLLFAAETVLGCNMIPSHKADLVRLLQRSLVFKPRVMAVGDGNNDISMLRQANVGVGISSHFNSPAAISSDIMAKEFSDLCELILTHGLRSHNSLAKSLLLALYGNLTMTLLLFYFSFTADYSSAYIIDPIISVIFSLVLLVVPLVVVGATDNSSYESKAEQYRKSYQFRFFSRKKLLMCLLTSLLHSGMLFLYVYPCFWDIVDKDGRTENVEMMGMTMFLALILTVLLQTSLEVRPNLAHATAILVDLGVVFTLVYLISSPMTFYKRLESSLTQVFSSPPAVIAMSGAIASCFAISLILKAQDPSSKAKVTPEGPSGRLSDYTGGLHRVYRNYKGWKDNEDTEVYKVHPYTAKFKSTYTEVKYINFYYAYQLRALRVSVGILSVISIANTLVSAAGGDSDVTATLMRAGFSGLLVGVLVWSIFKYFKQVYTRVILTVVVIVILGKFALEIIARTDGSLMSVFIPPFIFTLFCVDYIRISLFSVANILLTQISVTIYLYNQQDSIAGFVLVNLRLFVLTLGISAISAAVGYTVEVNNRERFKLIEISQVEIQKAQSILSFLLPAFVKERVKDGARYIAEDQGTVTIVFCDIYDFERICAEYDPTELTDFLDELFRKLDALCDVHGVTKIETVGKTYMACAGLRDSEAEMSETLLQRSHARRGVDLALDILRTIKHLKLKFGEFLQVKIGVNSGPVTAGVVGHHKPQFALVGDTVNTAARMCSTLPDANSVQITAETYELLGRFDGLNFTENQVEAKGKGTMHTKIVRENKRAATFISRVSVPDAQAASPLKPNQAQQVYEDKSLLMRKETELISRICSCQCSETEKQKEFRINLLEHNFKVMFAGGVTSLAVNGFLLLLALLEYYFVDNYAGLAQVFSRAIITLLGGALLAVLGKIYKTTWYLALASILSLLNAVVAVMSLIEGSDMTINLAACEVIFVLLYLSHCTGLFFVRVFPLSFVILGVWVGLAVFASSGADYVVPSLYIAFEILVNCFAVYYRESNMRTFANLKLIVDKENEKTESFLSHMMPAHVYENLKEGRAMTDRLPSVALLFADICGFTAWSSDKTPIEVVGMLSELFTNFDVLCVQYKVFKVCTIGDCYVVMGYNGLEYRDPADECLRVLEFAFEMIQVIKNLNAKHGSQLNMRIGLHLGEVIAGITGTNIVRYDIYGPDVLIANKMESGGEAGRINVSDVVRELVSSKQPQDFIYEFLYNCDISAKSVNRTHKSYFVVQRSINRL
jgi:phospholipid-translocating P-type ATPase (flippase)